MHAALCVEKHQFMMPLAPIYAFCNHSLLQIRLALRLFAGRSDMGMLMHRDHLRHTKLRSSSAARHQVGLRGG